VVPVVVALALWTVHGRRAGAGRQHRSAPVPPRFGSPWRSPVAWQLAAYFGVQSCVLYLLLGWLPTIEQGLGISAQAAGIHLGVFLIVGIAANVVVPPFVNVGGDQRVATTVVPGILLVAILGLWTWPSAAPVWVGLAGFAAGAAMVVALSLIP